MPEQKFIEIRGAREHNLKSVDVDIPRDRLVVHHRPVGLGQVLARLRHDLCRGPAPLRREPVGLRPPVPRHDAEAGRRPHLRPLPGDLDRAEDHLARTRARPSAPSPRSTTTCGCCSPASARPTRPPPACPSRRSRSARWSTSPWRCPRARAPTCWRPSSATARANTARNSRSSQEGLPARQGRRRVPRPRRRRRARQEVPAQHRRGGGPDRRARGAGDAPRGQLPHRARPRRRHRHPRDRAGADEAEARAAPDHLLGEVRLPGFGLHHPRDRAAALLLQRAVRRLPGLRRARGRALLRPAPDRARRGRCRSCDGAIAPWSKGQSPYYRQTIEALANHYGFDKSTRWRDLPEAVQEMLLYGSKGEKIRFRYDEGGRVYEISRALRGRHPQPRAPLPRDRQRLGRARRWSATRTAAPAASATATG